MRGSVNPAFIKAYLFGLSRALYLFTLGIFTPRHRGLIVHICRHFGYSYRTPSAGGLAPVSADSIAGHAGHTLRLLEVEAVDGNVTPEELIAICRIVRATGPRASFEFGTFDGRTTLNIAANSDEGTVVYTLDLPIGALPRTALALDPSEIGYTDKPAPGVRFQSAATPARIIQLYGDSARFDFSPYAGTIEFIFIDASHAYEYVLRDSESAMLLLGPKGGVILWHDYGSWDGVTGALDHLRDSDPRFSGLVRIHGTTLACLRVAASTES